MTSTTSGLLPYDEGDDMDGKHRAIADAYAARFTAAIMNGMPLVDAREDATREAERVRREIEARG